jgi:hypothetical protein
MVAQPVDRRVGMDSWDVVVPGRHVLWFYCDNVGGLRREEHLCVFKGSTEVARTTIQVSQQSLLAVDNRLRAPATYRVRIKDVINGVAYWNEHLDVRAQGSAAWTLQFPAGMDAQGQLVLIQLGVELEAYHRAEDAEDGEKEEDAKGEMA